MNKSKATILFFAIAIACFVLVMDVVLNVGLFRTFNNAMKLKKYEKKIFKIFNDSEIYIKKGTGCFYAEMDAYLTEANETRLVKLVSSAPPYDEFCAIPEKYDVRVLMLLIKDKGYHTVKISPDDQNIGYAFNWNWQQCISNIFLLNFATGCLCWIVFCKLPEELRKNNRNTRLEDEEMNDL